VALGCEKVLEGGKAGRANRDAAHTLGRGKDWGKLDAGNVVVRDDGQKVNGEAHISGKCLAKVCSSGRVIEVFFGKRQSNRVGGNPILKDLDEVRHCGHGKSLVAEHGQQAALNGLMLAPCREIELKVAILGVDAASVRVGEAVVVLTPKPPEELRVWVESLCRAPLIPAPSEVSEEFRG